MFSPRVFAVDCGAGHVSCGIVNKNKAGRLTLEHFAFESFNPDPSIENEWSGFVGQALADLLRTHKHAGPTSLSLPGHQTLGKFIKTPSVDKSKREKIFAFEAQQNIPYPLSEVVWDHLTVADDGLDMEIMLGAAKLDIVEETCGVLQQLGLIPEAVTPSSVAVLNCYRYNYDDVPENNLIVDIGAHSTHLIFVDSKRFFIRTLPMGGNTITQGLAEEIKQDFSHSESLKVQILSGASDLPESSPSRQAVAKAVQSFVGRLQLEITRSTVNYRRQSGSEQPATLFLTGGGSLIADLPQQLNERVKLPVERLDPLRKVAVSGKAASAAERAALLPGIIGLAIAAHAVPDDTVILTPPSIRKALNFRRRQPWLIAAAALFALAFVPPVVQYKRLHDSLTRENQRLDSAILPLQTVNNRNEANLSRIESARLQIDGIRSLAESKANWINFFTDLQERLAQVGDVWLDELRVQRDTETAAAAPVFSGFGGDDDDYFETPAGGQSEARQLIRLRLSGRLLDINNPTSRVSQDSFARVNSLLESFVGSQFISALESERFNADQPGILQFTFTLVVDPNRPL